MKCVFLSIRKGILNVNVVAQMFCRYNLFCEFALWSVKTSHLLVITISVRLLVSSKL